MHPHINFLIRGGIATVLILAFIIISSTTNPAEEHPEYTETNTSAPTSTPTEATEPTETETPAETTPAETAPPAATEQPTEPTETKPTTTWSSIGTFKLTAYCPCEKCCGYWATIRPLDEKGKPIVYTASGAVAEAGVTIAVDPNIIPHGTEVQINDHTYIAQDTGGSIKGNRIDVYFNDHQAALEFGVQYAEIFIKTTGL